MVTDVEEIVHVSMTTQLSVALTTDDANANPVTKVTNVKTYVERVSMA